MDMQYPVQALRLDSIGFPVVPMYGQMATKISWVDRLLLQMNKFQSSDSKKIGISDTIMHP